MKKLLLIICALGFAFGAGALHAQTVQCQNSGGLWGPCPFVAPVAVAKVSGTAQVNSTTSTTGTSVTHAFPGSTTAGNTILCEGMEAAAAAPTWADGQSNTFVVIGSGTTAPGYSVAIATNIVGGTTDTVTMTVTSGGAAFACYELTGTVGVGQAWDAFPTVQQGTGSSIAFPSATAFLPNEMVFSMVGLGGGTVNATPSLANVPTSLVTVDQSNTTITAGALDVVYSAHANVTNAPTFAQTVSLSASETYSAVLVTVKPAAFQDLKSSSDPCNQQARSVALINLTASGQLTTGVSGKQTYYCFLQFSLGSTADNVALVEGTGTTCATNTAGMAGGATAATGWNLLANGSVTGGTIQSWGFKTATAGDNTCLLVSSGAQVSGIVQYVQQ
jgi:hypothetical protein